MGILDFFRGGKVSAKNGVRGTGLVTSCTGYHEGTYQTCRMHLVIQADGVPATPVEFSGLVHNQKWPHPGMTLPVTVDPADPTRFTIEWGDVAKSRDRSAANAAAIAAAMRGSAGAGPPGAGPPGAAPLGGMFAGAQVINLSGRDPSQLTDEQRAKLQMLGIDPASLAPSGAPLAPPPVFPGPPASLGPPSPSTSTTPTGRADDTISRLERLAALRAQGVLNEGEFQAQKRAILGGG